MSSSCSQTSGLNTVKVRPLRVARLSAADCSFLQDWFGRGQICYINLDQHQFKVKPVLQIANRNEMVYLRLTVERETLWLAVSQRLVTQLTQTQDLDTPQEFLPPALRAMAIEQSLKPLFEQVEALISGNLQLDAVENRNSFKDAARHTDRRLLSFAIETAEGLSGAAQLIASHAGLEIIQPMFSSHYEPAFRVSQDFPFKLHCLLGQTFLTWPELRRLSDGDVVLIEHHLLGTNQVGLQIGDDFWCTANLVQGNLEIHKRGFDPVADNQPNTADANVANLPVKLVFELGRTDLTLGQLQSMAPGYVVKLGKDLSSPVNLIANGVRVARGQLVEVEGEMAVRVTEVSTQ